MPASPRETLLCRYLYDSLDQTIAWALDKQASLQRFYCNSRLATEIQAATKYCFFQHDDQVLAQRRQIGTTADTTLLATDQQRSVLNTLDATQSNPFAYSPYGHRPQGNGLLSLLGFNGERPDPVTGHYHLGNGYRQFNPVLMRFNSPDSWSPFGRGGLNAYAYCDGDSVNRSDPTGHFMNTFLGILRRNNNNIDIDWEPFNQITSKYKSIGGKKMLRSNGAQRKMNNPTQEVSIPLAQDLMERVVNSNVGQIPYYIDQFEYYAGVLLRRELNPVEGSSDLKALIKQRDTLEVFERIASDYMSAATKNKLSDGKNMITNYFDENNLSVENGIIRQLTPSRGKIAEIEEQVRAGEHMSYRG